MATEFLSICGPIERQSSNGDDCWRASLDLQAYRDFRDVRPAFLLFEGINQFAVRTARAAVSAAPERRYLPVSFKHFREHGRTSAQTYSVIGQAVPLGGPIHVTMTIVCEKTGGTPVAEAGVTVAEVPPLPGDGASRQDPKPAQPEDAALFRIEDCTAPQPDMLQFSFAVAPYNELLSEHFPGFPVAPASLTLDFISGQISPHFGGALQQISLSNTRFNKPLLPGSTYRCRVSRAALSAPGPLRFEILGGQGDIHVRGTFETSELNTNN